MTTIAVHVDMHVANFKLPVDTKDTAYISVTAKM